MDMDLSWCPVCERAIVERDETPSSTEGLHIPSTKLNKTTGACHITAKIPPPGQQRLRKSTQSGPRNPDNSLPKHPTDEFGELTDRGAVYAPKGGLYCSEACRATDELSGQRAFEDLAVLSCFLPANSVSRIVGPGRARSEPESDYCPSTTTTTSGTDEEFDSEARRLSFLNSTELARPSLGPKVSGHSSTGLRAMTPLQRTSTLRSLSDVSHAATVAITDQHTGRQCRSVEGSGLAKQKTPILLAPNGTPLIQRTFPQRHHIPLDQLIFQRASVPAPIDRIKLINSPAVPLVSLASDYGLFFNTPSGLNLKPVKQQRQLHKAACWSWDHLPADVPQYPAMNLARVRQSMGAMVDEKTSSEAGYVKQSRKKLFIFNQNV